MHMCTRFAPAVLLSFALWLTACGAAPVPSSQGPTAVVLGETTLLVVVNPVVNDRNQKTIAMPGTLREGIVVSVDGGASVLTGTDGIAVLAKVSPGDRVLSFSNSSATVPVTVVDRELRELAVSISGDGAQLISDVRYPFAGLQVLEVDPQMPITQVNAALNGSNRIVLFSGGTYTGDIVFSGSGVTLFGAGVTGGAVSINGKVEMNGSNNRIRGTRIGGNLLMNGGSNGLSFSSTVQELRSDGSSAVFVGNRICGAVAITGTNLTFLGNAGLAPLPAPAGGC